MSSEAMRAAVATLASELADDARPLGARFRTLFALRNVAVEHGSAAALAAEMVAYRGKSRAETALLRHECAFCLGQMGAARYARARVRARARLAGAPVRFLALPLCRKLRLAPATAPARARACHDARARGGQALARMRAR